MYISKKVDTHYGAGKTKVELNFKADNYFFNKQDYFNKENNETAKTFVTIGQSFYIQSLVVKPSS